MMSVPQSFEWSAIPYAQLNALPLEEKQKYLKKEASASEAAEQWRQAVDQIRRYAKSEAVNRMTAHTQLHLLVLQIQGFDLTRCEEVAVEE